MPRTIEEGFRDFLITLTPTNTETEASKRHRESIKTCLANNFDLLNFFKIGSFGHGTSIACYSDVDYLARLQSDNLHNDSDSSMRKVKNVLTRRFPFTNIRINCPAISIPFGSNKSEKTEIVIGDLRDITENGEPIYDIPNCNGNWRNSSPKAHNNYVNSIDKSLNHKVKPLIRFIKAWKYYNSVPISSFYLELRIAKYLKDEKFIIYSFDILRFFKYLYLNNAPSIIDPLGISGIIEPFKTPIQKFATLSKIKTALQRAEKAVEAEEKENFRLSFYWWNLFFNKSFPNYYYR